MSLICHLYPEARCSLHGNMPSYQKKKRKKKKHWIFIRIALNLYVILGSIEIFTVVNLPTQEPIYSRCPLCLQVHFLLFFHSGPEHFLERLYFIFIVSV